MKPGSVPAVGRQPPGASAAAPPPPPPVVIEPLDYTVQGDNLQVARIRLKPGQEIYAEAGKMVYKFPNVEWESRMTGDGLGAKLFGALKRKLMGESLFLTYFRAVSPGAEAGFAGSYPGRIQVFDLKPGQSILAQRDAFICAQSSVQLNIALVKRIGTGFFRRGRLHSGEVDGAGHRVHPRGRRFHRVHAGRGRGHPGGYRLHRRFR